MKAGGALDVLDSTGDLPRHACGAIPDRLIALGGANKLMPMLCLTLPEAAAFSVLLVDLTGENFGTVTDWTAACFRPDDGRGSTQVALVEETKPRRGPSREHMVIAIEDLPASLAGVIEGDDEHRLFRSPLRTYRLLLDLSALARKHGGLTRTFSYLTVQGRDRRWSASMHSFYVGRRAESHGFPRPPRDEASSGRPQAPGADGSAAGHGKPSVSTQRLRQTALERRRRPVAHSPGTLHDYYVRLIKPRTLVVENSADRLGTTAFSHGAPRPCEAPVHRAAGAISAAGPRKATCDAR